ncbi:2OG-Fe(II) oxygenase [Neobacillus sp. YIM B06451]|uniref:2OG-Fe(II) oxygenase n=1 Tax=Neobacillus sp. YIM B06451 TaxID=3070994 RepID=UPI00292DAB8E|nr:2OG-Fe(II) oxygenase [Neobacillus sp. YIM B06451]
MSNLAKEQTIFNHQKSTIYTEDRAITIIAKIKEPLIVVLDNVLDSKECDELIVLAKDRMKRSKISENHIENEIRTSSGMFFDKMENQLVAKIERRVSEIMCIPIEHGEEIQVLHYLPGQEYRSHFDYFSSKSRAVENNRISTLVMYLNDVEEGGETVFPRLNFSVTPKKGMAVYFEYFYEEQALNELTLHSGMPVITGEKWVATQWVRRKKLVL